MKNVLTRLNIAVLKECWDDVDAAVQIVVAEMHAPAAAASAAASVIMSHNMLLLRQQARLLRLSYHIACCCCGSKRGCFGYHVT
jgi:hypothetical protein